MLREVFLENVKLKLHLERRIEVEGSVGHIRMKDQHVPRNRSLQQNERLGKFNQFMIAGAKIVKGYLRHIALDSTGLSMTNPSSPCDLLVEIHK